MTPITKDLSYIDLDELLEYADDIHTKRQIGRSPAYICDGPEGTGKTSHAAAVGELMGGTTVILGPSALAPNTLTMIIDAMCPDIVVIDDFDKTTAQVRAQFYTSLVTLREIHNKTAWFITTNDAPGLGGPMCRPSRGGVRKAFPAPTRVQSCQLLVNAGIPLAQAIEIAVQMPEGMTHDWIVYLAEEIKQRPKHTDKLIYEWIVNWHVIKGTEPEDMPVLTPKNVRIQSGIDNPSTISDAEFIELLVKVNDQVDGIEAGTIGTITSPLHTPHDEHDYEGGYCNRLACDAFIAEDGPGPCFGLPAP